MKVLVVDDSAVDRLLMSVFLESLAELDFAVNGREAVDRVQHALQNKASYDLICLDLHMPEMNGLQALKSIRDLEKEHSVSPAKIFMITSSSEPDDMIEAIESGDCDDYIVKPVLTDTLLKILNKHNLLEGTDEE